MFLATGAGAPQFLLSVLVSSLISGAVAFLISYCSESNS